MSIQMKVLGVVAPLIARVVDLRPPSLEKQRAVMLKLELRAKIPAGVTVTEEVLAGLTVLHATSGNRDRGVVLHLHGGAYVGGSRHTARSLTDLVADGGPDLISVEYRLAPEHPFPAGLDDAVAAYRELIRSTPPERVVVMGESAGGGLVLALVQRLRDEGLPFPAGVVPVFPWADLELKGETMRTNSNKDSLSTTSLAKAAADYGGGRSLAEPGLSPVHGSFDGFPPTYIPVGTRDMLLTDARDVAAKLLAAGVDVTLREWPGCIHGFYVLNVPEARACRLEIREFVEKLLSSAP
jgi:monoterpene epsilon-lactone hydrolase